MPQLHLLDGCMNERGQSAIDHGRQISSAVRRTGLYAEYRDLGFLAADQSQSGKKIGRSELMNALTAFRPCMWLPLRRTITAHSLVDLDPAFRGKTAGMPRVR